MSKASEYASKRPKELRLYNANCYATPFNEACIGGLVFDANEALKLRDWLTDTFDEVSK